MTTNWFFAPLLVAAGVSALPGAAAAQTIHDITQVPDDDEQKQWLELYTEGEILRGESFVSQQATIAVNGDLDKSGFLLDFLGGAGGDSYVSDSNGKIDVVPSEAHALAGYRRSAEERYVWDVLIGWDYINYSLSRSDPSNPIRGARNGFKVSSSFETAEEKKYYLLLSGEYSTAFNTYFSNVRVGHRFGKIVVGPEGAFLGDQSFNSQRAGGFVQFPVKLASHFEPQLTISGGFSWVEGGTDGTAGGQPFTPGAGQGNGGYAVFGLGMDF